ANAKLPREVARMPRAPYAYLAEVAYEPERREMAARLHPGPEDRQHGRVGSGQVARGDGRNGGGAHLGNQPAVHAHQRLAGFGLEENEGRVVRRHTAVLRIEGHDLHPETARVRGHDAEKAVVL